MIRTGLGFDWVPGATVGEINAILDSIDATIDEMTAGASVLAVRIPDPGDLESYDLIVSELRANPLVMSVGRGERPRDD